MQYSTSAVSAASDSLCPEHPRPPAVSERRRSNAATWTFDAIPYDSINADLIRADRSLFLILAAASFIESAAGIFASNLMLFYADNPPLAKWLGQTWVAEEKRHGAVLKAYVLHVWPEFDWELAHNHFLDEYINVCTVDEMESSKALEMVARCMVEMSTSTYYQSIYCATDEPVLKQIVTLIKNDEIKHYSTFYRFFLFYNGLEGHGRRSIFGALRRRIVELKRSDAECALWHIYAADHPQELRTGPAFRRVLRQVSGKIRRHYPLTMAIKMSMKPLALPPYIMRMILKPLAWTVQFVILR